MRMAEAQRLRRSRLLASVEMLEMDCICPDTVRLLSCVFLPIWYKMSDWWAKNRATPTAIMAIIHLTFMPQRTSIHTPSAPTKLIHAARAYERATPTPSTTARAR